MRRAWTCFGRQGRRSKQAATHHCFSVLAYAYYYSFVETMGTPQQLRPYTRVKVTHSPTRHAIFLQPALYPYHLVTVNVERLFYNVCMITRRRQIRRTPGSGTGAITAFPASTAVPLVPAAVRRQTQTQTSLSRSSSPPVSTVVTVVGGSTYIQRRSVT